MNWGKTFGLTLVLGAMPGGLVWADEPADKRNEALAWFEKGNALAHDNEWVKAEQAYAESLRLVPLPKTAGMLGFVQVQLENYLAGAKNLEWFFQEETSVEVKKREQLRPHYVLAKEHVATIKIKVDPMDAAVSIDGIAILPNQLYWPHYVGAGTHVIEAKKDGFGLERQNVTVAIGMETPVELKMVAVPEQRSTMPTPEQPKTEQQQGNPRVPILIGAIAITGVSLIAGIGFGAAWKQKQDESIDAAWNRGCAENDCRNVYGAAFADAGKYKAGTAISLSVAGVTGISALAYYWATRNQNNSSAESRVTSLYLVPTINGVLLNGIW